MHVHNEWACAGPRNEWCPGGREVTDADILAMAAELADYEAAADAIQDRQIELGELRRKTAELAASESVEAALGVDDDQ